MLNLKIDLSFRLNKISPKNSKNFITQFMKLFMNLLEIIFSLKYTSPNGSIS